MFILIRMQTYRHHCQCYTVRKIRKPNETCALISPQWQSIMPSRCKVYLICIYSLRHDIETNVIILKLQKAN